MPKLEKHLSLRDKSIIRDDPTYSTDPASENIYPEPQVVTAASSLSSSKLFDDEKYVYESPNLTAFDHRKAISGFQT